MAANKSNDAVNNAIPESDGEDVAFQNGSRTPHDRQSPIRHNEDPPRQSNANRHQQLLAQYEANERAMQALQLRESQVQQQASVRRRSRSTNRQSFLRSLPAPRQNHEYSMQQPPIPPLQPYYGYPPYVFAPPNHAASIQPNIRQPNQAPMRLPSTASDHSIAPQTPNSGQRQPVTVAFTGFWKKSLLFSILDSVDDLRCCYFQNIHWPGISMNDLRQHLPRVAFLLLDARQSANSTFLSCFKHITLGAHERQHQYSVLILRVTDFPTGPVLDDYLLCDGDMLLTANQRDYLIDAEEKTQKTSGREKRQAIAVSESGLQIFNKTKPIFYIFTKSFSNPESRQTFHNVMDYLNSYTCLNITEGKSFVEGEQNVKVTTHPNYWCFGSIGYTGYGGDGIRLGKGCEEFYPISHEMLHNLGFYHTHQRHDRDDYVRIMIGPSHPNYNLLTKVTELENDNFGLPYDLGSIMHYVSTYPNGTMNAIDETKKYSVGATDNGLVAFSDLKMLNALYSCQESCPTSPECKNQGFRNPKDCNVCVCPRGFKGNDCTVPQFSKDTNETCGGILQAQASLQTFNSSMNSYTNSSENRPTLSTCFWHITAPEGKAVKVKLNSYSGSQSTAPCKVIGLEVRVDTFEIVGARICHPDMIEPTLEYNAPSNLAIVAAFTANNPINYSFSYRFVDQPPTTTTTTTTTTKPPTTTEDPRPFTPLNCSGAMDLVFVIDVCSTTEENLNLVKSQLEYAIKQNGIKWESTDNNTARLGIILSATSFADGVTTPYRYLDFQGHQTSPYQRPKLVTRTIHLKQVFRDIAFDLGINDIGLSMNYSINGDYATPNLPFGDPIFGSEGDRPNVPNAMIVITGADTSNVTLPSALLRNSNVDIYSIGFEDVSMAHLQAISGNPAKAFSTTRVNLANTISNICAGFLNE